MQGKRDKKLIFGATAVLLTFLLLVLLEGLMRLSWAEHARRDLFVTVPDHEKHVVINPCFARRYFAGFLPDVAPQPFLREKPSDTKRYFVPEGSAAEGFPYHF